MPSSSSCFPPAGVEPFLSEHDATWRDALHRLEVYSLSCLQRLSGNSQSAPLQGPTSLRNGENEHLFGAWRHRMTRDPTRTATFQTVSPRPPVNRRYRRSSE